MKQTIAMAALAVSDLKRSLTFYQKAFGWQAFFSNEHIAFFQMNGFAFSIAAKEILEAELGTELRMGQAPVTLAHNVNSAEEVDAIMDFAGKNGAAVLKAAVKREWGGYSGYLADPDGHTWEIAWNPLWKYSPEGYVSMGD